MSAEKLSLAEKRAVKAAIERARGTDKKGKSAQSSIPYQMLRPDGICQVTSTHFTKTIRFRDINYQLSDNEDKQTIFDSWCDFLNYFKSSVRFQLSYAIDTSTLFDASILKSIIPQIPLLCLWSCG